MIDVDGENAGCLAAEDGVVRRIESGAFAQNDFFEEIANSGFNSGLNPQLVETYLRDDDGRVTQVQRSYNGGAAGPSSSYTYRPDGRLGRVVNIDGIHDFAYNSRGLMDTETVSGEGTYTFEYDEMGRNNVLTYPDAHARRQAYDDLGRITSRCYDDSLGTTRCYTAQYDAVGNPVRMADPDGIDVLQYDALDRLTKVTRLAPDGVTQLAVEDYAYNALGALSLNAGVPLDTQRPRLDGTGLADSAVPASLNSQPVTLDAGGFITSLNGATFSYDERGLFRSAADPVPFVPEQYGYDAQMRRTSKTAGTDVEFYIFEGLERVATTGPTFAPKETYLFDGIDNPLRITQGATTAYYELDLAGNVRALHADGGATIGGYRYTAFGRTVEDTTTITQPLRWKGRWFSSVAGGIYDVRARQWAPELGAFLAVDEFEFHDRNGTLWSWPNENPVRWGDPTGNQGQFCSLKSPCDPDRLRLECQPEYDFQYKWCVQSGLLPQYCDQYAEKKRQVCITKLEFARRCH